VLYQAPCGSGKTVLFGHVAGKLQEAAARGSKARVLILVHRRELLAQTSDRLTQMGVPHGIIAAGYPAWPESPIQLASVQTVTRRLASAGQFNLVICDESHHILADSYNRIIDGHQPGARVLGLTATPLRLDGRGLGRVAGGPFDSIVVGPSIKELVRDGYLTAVDVYAPPSQLNLSRVHVRMGDYDQRELEAEVDKPAITGNAIEHYQRICPGERAMVFCISVKHAHDVAQQFNAAGIPAEGIDGSMKDDERRGILDRFDRGDTLAMTSCDLVGEGLDICAVGAVISLRPTKSLNLYIQQVGRAQRIAPGKARAVLLDHVSNCERHGMPDADRTWSLDGKEKKQEAPRPSLTKCLVCFFVCDSFEEFCPRCGAPLPKRGPRTINEVDGQLERVINLGADRPDYTAPSVALSGMAQMEAAHATIQQTWEARTRARLERVAREKGYKQGWIQHTIERQKAAMQRSRSAK
jgi:DNA repair protein RadD